MFLNECFLQKVNHYDALVVINDDKEKLSLGKELVLEIDNDNDGKEAVFAKLDKAIIGVLSEEDEKDHGVYGRPCHDQGPICHRRADRQALHIHHRAHPQFRQHEPEDPGDRTRGGRGLL